MNEIAAISEEMEDLDQIDTPLTKNFEAEKQRVLFAISRNSPKRLLDRVAWILNHYTNARDSDIACQLHYWKTFQGDLYSGGNILQENYPKLERLNSITRARARVQNDLKMFIASPEVRKRRGKLEDEEKQRALEERPTFPIYCIYADESGKTSKYLLVGSVWVLRSYETIKITNAINQKSSLLASRAKCTSKK